MREVLVEALRMIGRERKAGAYRESFALVASVVREYGEAELAERLYADIPDEVPREVVADLFGLLEWAIADNGASLHRCAERWLRSADDAGRVQVALGLDAYPFEDQATMELVLLRVASRLPEQASRCRELIESRRRDVKR